MMAVVVVSAVLVGIGNPPTHPQTHTQPNTCQPRALHPFMPIYHIIGNVTTNTDGIVTDVESINDVSSAILYKGVYHVFHQCCQNHWDHVVSKDLIHWTRLPPPVVPNFNPTGVPQQNWYDARGSWDGSLSIPNEWNSLEEPVIIMTAVEGSKTGKSNAPKYVPKAFRSETYWKNRAGMGMAMAVVRPTNSTDPFLLSWMKDAANPINYTSGAITSPYDTPGQVWKNGDHWNFLNMGVRYTTKDPTFHTWGAASGKWPTGENGGEWFSKLPNQKDGSPAPAGSPGWMINVAGGNKYVFGEYDSHNESWTSSSGPSTIDYGPNSNWMVGQFMGDRFMNIGWSLGGPPMWMMSDELPLQSPFLSSRSSAPFCSETTSWEVLPGYTNIWDREPSPTNITHGTLHFIGIFDSVDDCFAAVNASTAGPFHSFTYNDATVKDPYGKHCWADTSFTWQGKCCFQGQVSGRGPGFPVNPPPPPLSRFTHDHLGILREVAYDPAIKELVSNPVSELVNLRNGTLAGEAMINIASDVPHVAAGTGGAANDASTSDIVLNVTVPQTAGDFGVSVLSNVTNGTPMGGILVILNFTAPNGNGSATATASIQTLNPCGGLNQVTSAPFSILQGESVVDVRVLVDRSVVEAFVMGGRVVFSKTFNPPAMYVPDTNVVFYAWRTEMQVTYEVYSMGCGWSNPPYQPNPTIESISQYE